MPEGPEIWRQVNEIARAIEGERVRVELGLERLAPWEPILDGARVLRVRARGKAVLVDFEDGHTLYGHNQLYGRWIVHAADRPPTTGRKLRVRLATDAREARLYSASDVEVWATRDLGAHPYLAKLGPDVCAPETTEDEVWDQLTSPRFARRSLAALLLDQAFLAGVGNYLRAEICFVAGVSPRARPVDLDDEALARLAWAALALPRRSLETKGITNEPALYRALKSTGWSRRDARHFIFNRDGLACFACGEKIERQDLGGRRVYWCPGCQPSPG